ncbi:MAG: hypothetical protein RR596_01745, partial [Enterococcus sp.]
NEESYPDSLHDSYVDSSEENKPKNKKTVKHKHGTFENVLLTDVEFEKIKERFPRDYGERIEKLSGYIASVGKKYKSHYATILNWARNSEEKQGGGKRDTTEYDNLF